MAPVLDKLPLVAGVVVLALVVIAGFVWRYSPWLKPSRRRHVEEEPGDRLDLHNPRDAATVLMLVLGTAIGVVLAAGALLSRIH
jgi:hypothetical protein